MTRVRGVDFDLSSKGGKLPRRDLLLNVCAVAAAHVVPKRVFASEPTRKPNIILILADDLGYGDLGCYGNTDITTPSLDALAMRGMRFTDFHSNGAMCSPTRAALLTGRYQQRCGIESVLSSKRDRERGLPLAETTFAAVFRDAGYATAIFGKWHLGYTSEFSPLRHGFDQFRGFVAGGLDYHSHIDRSGRPDWRRNDQLEPDEGYTTDLLTDYGIRFIEENKDRSFCLYMPYQAVHFPFQGPRDKADRVTGGDYWSDAKYGSRKDRKAAYKEMVESLDHNIGRIVSTLRRLQLQENTFLFFTSDNGAYSWVGRNSPCSGQKGSLLEGGHRVPAIAYWPGIIRPGVVSDQTLMTIDLFPTMAAMSAVELPMGIMLDGVDFGSILTGRGTVPDRMVFFRTSQEGAVRRGPWKLLIKRTKKNVPAQLFNLEEDIGERHDLAKRHPGIAQELAISFDAWEEQVAPPGSD
ncbi:MAG: sulfatase-like hydrolase/transferase [Planctomycetota bacterium]